MSPSPTIADALAGADYIPSMCVRQKTALVAGAAGKLGERILARLLSSPEYRCVYALASNSMLSTEPKLTALLGKDWNFPIDDVIAVAGDEAGALPLSSRRRTEVFSILQSHEVMPLARQAHANGTTRFMAITPVNVLMQPAALYGGLANIMEAELHQLKFASLILVRPSSNELRRSQQGITKRLVNLLINTLTGLMAGKRHAPLSVDDTARAIVHALQDAEKGLKIIETDHLHGLLTS